MAETLREQRQVAGPSRMMVVDPSGSMDASYQRCAGELLADIVLILFGVVTCVSGTASALGTVGPH